MYCVCVNDVLYGVSHTLPEVKCQIPFIFFRSALDSIFICAAWADHKTNMVLQF